MRTLFAALLLLPSFALAQNGQAPTSLTATAPIRISLDARGEDVREVLATLFSEAKKPYALDAAIKGKLYVRLDAMAYDKALGVVLTQAGLVAKDRDGVVMVTVAPTSGGKPPVLAAPISAASVSTVKTVKPTLVATTTPKAIQKATVPVAVVTPATYAHKVTTRLTRAALADVFAAFGTQANVTIEVAPSVPAYRVDAFFVKTSLKYALNRVCKAAGLKYEAVDGKIIVRRAE